VRKHLRRKKEDRMDDGQEGARISIPLENRDIRFSENRDIRFSENRDIRFSEFRRNISKNFFRDFYFF
jgi:hypothetical protein